MPKGAEQQSIAFDEAVWAALVEIADERGTNASEVVRVAVDVFLVNEGRTIPRKITPARRQRRAKREGE